MTLLWAKALHALELHSGSCLRKWKRYVLINSQVGKLEPRPHGHLPYSLWLNHQRCIEALAAFQRIDRAYLNVAGRRAGRVVTLQ